VFVTSCSTIFFIAASYSQPYGQPCMSAVVSSLINCSAEHLMPSLLQCLTQAEPDASCQLMYLTLGPSAARQGVPVVST
jgi:hypothetical protein